MGPGLQTSDFFLQPELSLLEFPEVCRVRGGSAGLLLDGFVQRPVPISQFANTSLDRHGLRLHVLGTTTLSARNDGLWNHIAVTPSRSEHGDCGSQNGR